MRISTEREFDLTESETGFVDADADLAPALEAELARPAVEPLRGFHGASPLVAARSGSAEEAALIRPAPAVAVPASVAIIAAADPVALPVSPFAGGAAGLASRALDCVLALVMLVVLLPAMVLIFIALRLSEPGPALFPHRRIGRDGQSFACLKFRTMCVDADRRLEQLLAEDEALLREWTSTQKLLCDPRVTRLGRFLRNTSLDELPQLFNVLRGDMALVGPRPIVADELRRYGRHANDYCSVRPGLTGLWQVIRDEHTTYRRRVAADVHYVRNRSIAYDLKIMLATIPAVLLGNQ